MHGYGQNILNIDNKNDISEIEILFQLENFLTIMWQYTIHKPQLKFTDE